MKTIVRPYMNVRGMVPFPGSEVFLMVGRERSIEAIEAALADEARIVVISQRNAEINDLASLDQMFNVGVEAIITQHLKIDEAMKIYCKCEHRVKIERHPEGTTQRVEITPLADYSGPPRLKKSERTAFEELLEKWCRVAGHRSFEENLKSARQTTGVKEYMHRLRNMYSHFSLSPPPSKAEIKAKATEGLGPMYQQLMDATSNLTNDLVANRQKIMEETDLTEQWTLIRQLVEREIPMFESMTKQRS